MKCPECGKKMSRKKEKYHYLASGLDNIYLLTDVYKCASCNETIADIPSIDGLHELIAKDLIKKTSVLTGKEFRFIRKQLRLKAKEIASLLGVNKVTVSRWENDQEIIGSSNDKLIRLIYTQKFQETCNKTISIIDELSKIKRTPKRRTITIDKKNIQNATCYI